MLSRAHLPATVLAVASTAALWFAPSAMADQSRTYKVTIKNLTGG